MTTNTDALYVLALMDILAFGVIALIIALVGDVMRWKSANRVAAAVGIVGFLGFFAIAFYAFAIMLGEMW